MEDERLGDEPLSGLTDDPNHYRYLSHIHTTNQPETFEILKQFENLLQDYSNKDGHHR